MFRIKGYEPGANISILNTIYHKPKKDENGCYSKDSLDIIFKDLDTGEKHLEHIPEPEYTFYEANSNVNIPTNVQWIEKEKVHPVTCKYKNILKTIADLTNNSSYFYDNIRNGNYRENERLLYIPSILNADMDIEDYYRMEFAKTYKNNTYEPELLFFDIEVDGIDLEPGTFPGPGQCPINATTLIDDKYKNVYCLLLNNPDNPQISEFMHEKDITKQLKDFVQEHVGGWKNEKRFKLDDFKYHIMFYDQEIKLIYDVFNTINTIKPDFVLAWNIAFDLPYIIERINLLGYNPTGIICSEDFPVKECWYFIDKRAQKFEERNDYGCVSSYSVYLDQLITFASRRKGQKKKKITSFKLDFIGSVVAGVRKLDYSHITHDIMQLPYLDYKTFAFYNVMDTIVQLCIERKVGDLSFLLSKSLSTNTRYAKIHRQTIYLINRATKDYFDMGYIIGNNINKHNEKLSFSGAYVGDPLLVSDKPKMKINNNTINICENCDDFDYARLTT